MQSLLIVVSGFSCTGKTTLAQKIAKRYSLPLISRDDIKESLYNSLGYSDREWSKKLGVASYELLYLFLDKILVNKQDLIVESNFQPEFDERKFLNLKNKHQFNLLQIHCYAATEVILERFKNRAISGTRHPGHVDHLNNEEIKLNLQKGSYEIFKASDRSIKIDTTDFNLIDYEKIYTTIEINSNMLLLSNKYKDT